MPQRISEKADQSERVTATGTKGTEPVIGTDAGRTRTSSPRRLFNILVLCLVAIMPLTSAVLQTGAAAAAGTLPGTATATAAPAPTPTATPAVTPTPSGPAVPILVKFAASVSEGDRDAAIHKTGGQSVRDLRQIHTRVIDVPASMADRLVAAYARLSSVVHASRAITLTKASVPNDPGYPQQWALPKIAWDQAYGSITPAGTAKIAVLDTGVDATHPDLAGQMTTGISEIGGDPNTDPNGHGTELAGIAAASVDNGVGMAGVDYAGASISSVQVLGADGTGTDADVTAGVLWAADNGANVILMAFYSSGYSPALADAISYAESKGAVVVAATGNSASNTPTYPAGDPGVIGVAATDQNDNLVSASDLVSADVAAPGVSIYSTQPGGNYSFISGTSASAAEVAGLAGLLIANGDNATQTYNQIIGATAPIAGQTFGRIDVLKALGSSVTVTPQPTPSTTPTPGPSPTYVTASNANISGSVYDSSTGATISGATITCPLKGSPPPPYGCNAQTQVQSGSGGAYSFTGLTFSGSGPVQLCATKSGYGSQTVVVQTTNGKASYTGVNFSLVSGGSNACATNAGPPPTQLVFLPAAGQTLVAGTLSSVITVQLEDQYGNPITPTSANGLTVNLSATGTSTGKFFDSAGQTQITSVLISADTTTATFTFKDTSVGNLTITGASSQCGTNGTSACTSATQTEKITPVLVFNTISDADAGTTLNGGSVTVTEKDANSPVNTVTSYSGNITVSIGTNPSGGTLSGTLTQTPSSGVAAFNNLSIDKVGTGYTLLATVAGNTATFASNSFNIKTRTTQTTVSCSPSPVNINSNTTCTATVTDTDNGSKSTPAGTVSFTSSNGAGTFPSGTSCTLTTGSCSVTYTQSSTGSPTISGTYNPTDSLHAGSSGSASPRFVDPTTTTVSCSPNPVGVNANTTCTASVKDTASSPSTPTGTVTWSTSTDSGFTFSSTTCTLSGSGATATCSVTYSQNLTGTPTITANYGGDAAHNSSSGNTSLAVGQRSTTTSVSCSPASVDANSPTTCTATVTDTAGGTTSAPGGTVTFSVSPNTNGSFSNSGSCTLTGSTSPTTCSVTYTPSVTGSPAISASYTANDGSHANSSTTTAFTVTVNARSTTTSVSCTPNPVDIGNQATCTATVTDSDANGTKVYPAGTVAWSASPSGSGSFSNSASCTLTQGSPLGTSTCSVNYTPSSSSSPQSITAAYSPNDNVHSGSNNNNGSAFSLTVNKRIASVTVSCTPGSVHVGVGTSCQATVADNDTGSGGTPTGTITWSVAPTTNGGFSSTTCTLSSGSCSVTYTPTATGSPSVTAGYGGDSTHRSSSGNTTVTVSARTTSTSVSCTPNPVDANAGTTCTATVSDTDTGTSSTPGGTITWSVSPSNGSFSSSTCNLSAGSCSVTYTANTAGSPGITASYGGDSTHSSSSNSPAYTVTVNKRSTSTSVTCAATTVTIGSGTTCTATVTDTDANGTKVSPTGTVSWTVSPSNGSFTAAAGSTFSSGPPPTCTLTSTNGSTAACSVTYTASTYGSPNVTGAYGGDGSHSASNGSTALTATVGLCAGATTTALAMCGVSLTAGFPTLTLNGQDQSAFASLSTINVQDQQASGNAGWNVTVQASRLACTPADGPRCPAGGDTLPAGELLMAGPLAEGPSGSQCISGCGVGGPLSLPRGTTPFLIDTGTSVKIASYANGDPSYTLKPGTVDGTAGHNLKVTAPADAYATTYHTTITLTVATGP